jgi:hypothetical protein
LSDHQSEASGPAALFWAATAYNITDGMMTAAPQLMRSIIYFGRRSRRMWWDPDRLRPRLPPRLRLYGTGVEFYDQSWKPDDVVKVK